MTQVRKVFADVELRDMVSGYCEAIWRDGWKAGKTKALQDPEDPFQGGPQSLIDRGITSFTKPDGSEVQITKLTRIRMQDLDDKSLEKIGILDLKGTPKGKPGADVVHQEYVETFQENIDNDYKHFLNNAVAAAGVLDTALSYVTKDTTTVEELAALLEDAVNGNQPDVVLLLSLGARAAWIGRAVQDKSWKSSGDFVFASNLKSSSADLDPYVVVPVLKLLVADLRAGKFDNTTSESAAA